MKITEKLPKEVMLSLQKFPYFNNITELRLRVNNPVLVKANNQNYYLSANGFSLLPNAECIIINQSQINNTFYNLCNNSVYSHQEEIKQGFISAKDGVRIGICGAFNNGNVKYITALNIRFAHQIKNISAKLLSLEGGIIFVGPPHSGKTTFLRDYIRLKSDLGFQISLIDCRGEISGITVGKAMLDVGKNTDIFFGGKKSEHIENAIRTMNPDIIAFDEVGTNAELSAVTDCLNAGVNVVTSFHAKDMQDFILRNNKIPILLTGAFSSIVFLDKNFNATIIKAESIYDKSNRGIFDNIVQCYDRNNTVFCPQFTGAKP